jgi:acyl carrier protein
MTTVDALKQIVEKVKGMPGLSAQLTESTDLVDGVKLDSLAILQFMLEVESRLSIRIDFDKLEFDYLRSLRTLADFLDTMPSRQVS